MYWIRYCAITMAAILLVANGPAIAQEEAIQEETVDPLQMAYEEAVAIHDDGDWELAVKRYKEILKQDCLSSLNLIKDYINNLCIKHKLTLKDCFIIGFSQGAMMAFEFGKYVNNALAGCVLLSGRILPSEDHEKRYFIETPVLIVHGDQDTVLEPKYFEEACKILKNHGFLFDSYLLKNEVHTVSLETLKLTKNFIKKHMT